MTFMLLPAVDIASGQAVRLARGLASSQTIHGAPLEAALAWQSAGAEWIHLVDLDAALGRGSNAELLQSVAAQLDVKVELSAGICDDAGLEWALSTGCERVILSTNALKDLAWCSRVIEAHGERVAIGLDVQVRGTADGQLGHELIARGWTQSVGNLWDVLSRLDRSACARYVVTDVSKDGMLNGPNVELYQAVANFTSARVLASGGVSALGDLAALVGCATAFPNIEGAIIGKALYAGRFTLSEALRAVCPVAPDGSSDPVD